MNKIIITGNLGKDAEVRQSANGTSFLSFTIADNEVVKGEKKTFWYDVVAFNYSEKLVQYYKKGSSLMVTGTLVADSETGKDGVTRCRRSVTAVSIDFIGATKQESQTTTQQTSSKETAVEEAEKQVNMYAGKPTAKAEPTPAPKPKTVQVQPVQEEDESELPF